MVSIIEADSNNAQASRGPIHLQQYDCVPGGWQHDALASWRIAFQQAGAPRIQRVVEGPSERRWRRPGKNSISPPNAQSWRSLNN